MRQQRAFRAAEAADEAPLVLLVDDFDDAREMYGTYLRFVGLRVEVAADAETALEMAFAEAPDVIVMDLGLPRVDGIAAMRQLKLDPRTRRIPIVVVTGHVEPQYIERAREAGAEEVLAKPCLPAQLAEALRSWLPPPGKTTGRRRRYSPEA
jgi:CheY-like chemotaxis protein